MADGNIWTELEDVKRRTRAPATQPEITIQRAGSIGLNGPAVEALGHPTYVRLMIRRQPPLLGIRPSDEHPDAYTVQDNAKGAVVNARVAVETLAINHDIARRYPAEAVEGGGLIIDFTKPGLAVSPGQAEKATDGAENGAVE